MATDYRAEAVHAVEELLTAMNRMSDTGLELTMTDVERMFTPDCEMTLNGVFICRGFEGLLFHSLDIKKKLSRWKFNLPFEHTVVEAGKVLAYYTCDVVAHDGSIGKVYDMCIYSTRNGKISGVFEVVHFQGHVVQLDSF